MNGCETASPPALLEQIIYKPNITVPSDEPAIVLNEAEIQSYLDHTFPELSSVPYKRNVGNSTLLTTGKHEARHMLVALQKNAHVSYVEVNEDGTGVTHFSGNFSADDFYAIAAAGYQNDWEGGAADRWMIEAAGGNIYTANNSANASLQNIPDGYISIVGEMLAYLGRADAHTINSVVNRAKMEYEIRNNPSGNIGAQIEEFVENNGFFIQTEQVVHQPTIIITTDSENQKYTAQYIVDDAVEISIEKCLICGCEGGAHDHWRHQTRDSIEDSKISTAELIQPPVITIDETSGGIIFEEVEI